MYTWNLDARDLFNRLQSRGLTEAMVTAEARRARTLHIVKWLVRIAAERHSIAVN
jgi:hypothetical protein